MQLWTFGLILLLILSIWMTLSSGMPDKDEDDDDENCGEPDDDCRILKKQECHGGKRRSHCKETICFHCSPTCRLYERSTKMETSKDHTLKTIYLCPTSTIIQSSITSSMSIRSNPSDGQISSTIDNGKLLTKSTLTPSFPVSSTVEVDGSGDEPGSGDAPISSPVSIFSSHSTATSSSMSSAVLEFLSASSIPSAVMTIGKDVFSSVIPSFTVQFPSTSPSTATTKLFGEASASTVRAVLSPSPTLETAAPSSSHGSDNDDGGDDNDDDKDDGDDKVGDDHDQGSGDDDNNDECDDDGNGNYEEVHSDDVIFGSDTIERKRGGHQNSKKAQLRKSVSKSNLCKISSIIQSTRIPNSLIKTSQEHVLSKTSSIKQLPSKTVSMINDTRIFNWKTLKKQILSSTPSEMITETITSQPIQPSISSYSISPTVTSSMLPTFIISTDIPKQDTNGTEMSTKFLYPSTLVPTSGGFSLTTSVTPPLLSSISSESSRNIAPTPVLSSSSGKYSATPPLLSSISSESSGNIAPTPVPSSSSGQYSVTPPLLSSMSSESSGNIAPTSALSSFSGKYTAIPPLLSSISSESSGNIAPTPVLSSSPGQYSVTPPLLSSISSESSGNIAPTPALSSSSGQYSKINSTLPFSSLNVTRQISTSISPTRSTTVVVSSSVPSQEHTVYCGKSKTGEKFEKGILSWKRTPVGGRANVSCIFNQGNNTAVAYRYCRMNMTTISHYWDEVHDENCSVLEKDISIDELTKMEITKENESRMAVLIDYITSTSNATVDLVKGGADLLAKLVDGATNLSKIRKELLSSISNVMNADPAVLAEANKEHKSTTKILKYIGKLMDEMSLSGQKFVRENLTNLVAEAWDVANKSGNLTFETSSPDESDGSLVSVTLPASLVQRYKEKKRITFINFLNDKLFPQDTDHKKKFINSKIVSASIKGGEVKNLTEKVVIEFRITNKTYANNCSCVFWDFEADGGFGRWSSNGCEYEVIGDGRSRCSCSHLTHFGILVDLFPNGETGDTDQLILEGITFVGCYLSIVGLVLTIITLLSFKQYRNGVSGQILLNLCLALLFSLVIFLGGIEQVDDEGTCVTMGALLHYFVLAAVLWMGVEAFHMFVNIVLDRLPGELGRTFVLKCAAVAWVVPMFIVVITVLVSTDDYKNGQYCRVKGKSFYIAFLVPTLTVLLFNAIIFLLVVKALLSTRVPGNRHKQGIVHFRRVLGIAVVFGITWLFGVLAIGELRLIFQYLFCITNSFQGFMIFILYCLTDRKVRERLVRFLCALPDPNKNRIIDSTSTQRPTDIDINLSMFEARLSSSSRPRNWSGTWPMSGHTNPPRITPEETIDPVIVYPPPAGSSYIPNLLESGYSSNLVGSSYNSNLAGRGYNSNPVDPGYDSNPAWKYEHDDFDRPYNYRNPPGSLPVTNVPLPGEVSGDALVDSTLLQYFERSGGEVSLQSANSIVFFNNGQRVVVPRYPELPGSNNDWEETRMDSLEASRTYDGSLEGPRRYSQGGDGLSFYKPRQQRHNSATTSAELNKKFYPKGKVHRNKGVHFSADQLANSPKEPARWTDVGAFPRLKTHPRQEDISEIDEHGDMSMSRGQHEPGMSMSRAEHEPRRIKSAQPSTRVIADDEVEEEYLRDCGKNLDKEYEVTSNFLAASESKNSRELKPIARSKNETPLEAESDAKFREGSGSSSSSETSSNTSFRWSEAGHAPNLKSYSLTTFSELNSDDGLDEGDGTHFTQF